MSLDQDVKTISGLVDKVRHLVPELRDVEDIQVYQDECLLTLEEKVDVINTQEAVVIIPEAWVKTEEDVSRKKRSIKVEGGAPKKARISSQSLNQQRTSWKNLPDLVFDDVMMMAGQASFEDLCKCRQICQRWNVMMSQMTLINKYIVRTIGQWDRGSDRHTYTGM